MLRALVLANKAKQDQALKMNDPSVLTLGPKTRVNINQDGEKKPINADGKHYISYKQLRL